jgi:cytochrome c oxidase subunit II
MKIIKSALIALSLAALPVAAAAQAPATDAPAPAASVAPAATEAPAAAPAPASPAPAAAAPAAAKVKVEAPTPQKPVEGIGQPVSGLNAIGIQPQVTDLGEEGKWMHNALLLPIITIISLFVLLLMIYVMVRFRRGANPQPTKTTHNVVLEIAWTVIPALILVGIAFPSISLLAKQYKPASKDAVVVKVTGSQWLWTYSYPDHGDFEVVSNMLSDEDAKKAGEPRLLGVDNRMVVPVDTEIKAIVTSADVIHSWAVPAFWTKMDAVPGRLNEVTFKVQKGKEGVYYGQCSELCGARHGFMPIAVEVVSKEKFAQWVASKDGKMPGSEPAAAAPVAAPASPSATPAPTASK